MVAVVESRRETTACRSLQQTPECAGPRLAERHTSGVAMTMCFWAADQAVEAAKKKTQKAAGRCKASSQRRRGKNARQNFFAVD